MVTSNLNGKNIWYDNKNKIWRYKQSNKKVYNQGKRNNG